MSVPILAALEKAALPIAPLDSIAAVLAFLKAKAALGKAPAPNISPTSPATDKPASKMLLNEGSLIASLIDK